MFYTIQSLQKAYAAERPLDLWEILNTSSGRYPGLTRRELAEKAFERFVQAVGVDNQFYLQTREIFVACLTDKIFRQDLADQQFGKYAADPQRFAALSKLEKVTLPGFTGILKRMYPLPPLDRTCP